MKDNFVINLGRQLGSGGREIGEKLAKELNIAFYDKEQKSSMIYSGYDFIKETSLNGLSKVITTYNDTFVATINPDVLKEKGTTIEELAQLSQSLPAESNPILCLFTFK